MAPANTLPRRTTSDRLRLQAAGWAALWRAALWLLPFRTVRAAAQRLAALPALTPRPTPEAIRAAVAATPRAMPRCTCLVQALTAHVLLRRAGHPSEIRLGVSKTPTTGFTAHAWTVSGDVVVSGGGPGEHVALDSEASIA